MDSCEAQARTTAHETEACNEPQDCGSNTARVPSEFAEELARVGRWGLRYGLVAVIGWIGAMKFTTYEAEGISGLVSNSPLMRWAYDFMTHRQFSVVLGVVELAIALLIGAKSIWPSGGVIGAVAAIGMFLTTLSFMFTTPGVVEASAGGFPAISAMPGQFLIKDLVLLAASVWLLGDAFGSASLKSR